MAIDYTIWDLGLNPWLQKSEGILSTTQVSLPDAPLVMGGGGIIESPISNPVNLANVLTGSEVGSILAHGKRNFTDTTAGFMMGQDSDGVYKWTIGDASSGADWAVTSSGTFTIKGTLTAGQIHIPDVNTTTNSFHVNTSGSMWIGATQTNFNTSNENAQVYFLNTGVGFLRNTLQVGVSTGNFITIDGVNQRVRSSTYSTGVSGFTIEPTLVEAENIIARGIMRGSTFMYDVISAVGGQVMIANSDILASDMTALDASTLTTRGTTTWAVNDIMVIRQVTALGIQEEWLRVTSIAAAPTYTVTRDLAGSFAANTNPIWQAGTTVVRQGSSDGAAAFSGGWLRLFGEGTNSPYYSVYRRTGVAYNTFAEVVRMGNLNGYLGYVADTFGFGVGSSGVGEANITIDPTNGLRMRQGTTNLITMDNAGTATLLNLTVGGSLNVLTSGNIRSGQTAYNTGTGWFWEYNGGTPRMSIGNPAGNYLTYDGTDINFSGTLTVGSFPNIPTDNNLAAYWAFDEGSGTVAYDGSVNNNTGIISNCTWVTGVSGQSLSFNGTTSYVQVNDNSTIQNIFDGGGAVSVWINPASDGELNVGRIMVKQTGTSGSGWTISTQSEAGGFLRIYFTENFSGVTGEWYIAGVSINTWHHLVISYNADAVGNDPAIYLDGITQTVTEQTTPVGTRVTDVGNDLWIGNASTNDVTFDGRIDEPRLYSSSLTVNQVKALYTNPAGNNTPKVPFAFVPIDENMVGYWAFDERAGTTALDSTLNANNGVITGAVYVAGASGTGLDFDGVDDIVTITDNAAIQNIFDGGGALSVWINPDSDGELDEGRGLDKSGWLIATISEAGGYVSLRFAQFFSVTNGTWDTAVNIPINTWTHVVIVYNSDSITNDPTVYINGTSVTVTEVSVAAGVRTTDVGSNLIIGNNVATTATFDGTIDEVRLYSSTLTALQARALYLNPTGNQTTRIGPNGIVTSNLSSISADIGTITAGSIGAGTATIGAFNIGASTISATNLTLTSGAANTANIAVGTGSNLAGMNSGNAASDIAFWAGSTFANRATAPFRVEMDGSVTCTDIAISTSSGTANRISITSASNQLNAYDASNNNTIILEGAGYLTINRYGTNTGLTVNLQTGSGSSSTYGLRVNDNTTDADSYLANFDVTGTSTNTNALVGIINGTSSTTGRNAQNLIVRNYKNTTAIPVVEIYQADLDKHALFITNSSSRNDGYGLVEIATSSTASYKGVLSLTDNGITTISALHFGGTTHDATSGGGTKAGRVLVKIDNDATQYYLYLYSD